MFFSKISAQPVHSPRSGRLPLLLINLSPRLAHTGMALRDARGALLHKAKLDGSGAAMRVGARRATSTMEAEVGRFEPCDLRLR